MNILVILVVLAVTLLARDNPFKPVVVPQESGKVAEPEALEPFEKLEITLPSSSRKIKSVTIKYQNLDGSIDTIEKRLDNDVDWHFPILISHKPQNNSRQKPKEEPKERPKEMQTTEQMVATQERVGIKDIMDQDELSPSPKKIEGFEFVFFEIDKNVIYIHTKDEKIRDFPLSEPTKVVIDLKRPVTFKSKIIETRLPYFEEIAIGNHSQSYRLAIKLDGLYKYTIERFDGGYKITLK